MRGALDEEIRERLSEDCSKHQRVVHEAIVALARGHLEHEVVARTCGRELHSAKGVAGVLGLATMLDVVGDFCDRLGEASPPDAVVFFEDFEQWFSGFLACMLAALESDLDEVAIEALTIERTRLAGQLRRISGVAKALPASLELSPSAGRRLLLVDDSATVRFATAAKLVDRGYPVETAEDLGEVARLLMEFDPEIVVTDVNMPEVDGDELCRRIKAHMRRVVPVILYSGLPEGELERRAEAAGADGFVSKQAGITALVRRMDEILSEEILF